MLGFSGNGDDYLLVDKIIILLKKLVHHVNELFDGLKKGLQIINTQEVKKILADFSARLHQSLEISKYFRTTFGWFVEHIMKLIQQTQNLIA